MSGCAFHVQAGSQNIHEYVHHERLATPQLAEMRALYLLMQYIQRNIEPGSTVRIYGDAGDVIRKAEGLTKRSGKSGKTTVAKTRKLLKRLHNDYVLTLQRIPKKENRVAHKLSRKKYVPSANMVSSPKNHTFKGKKTIALNDIIIPNHMKYGRQPKVQKYQSRLKFYQEFGYVQKTIQINTNNILLDGYISYLILKRDGISECTAEVWSYNN